MRWLIALAAVLAMAGINFCVGLLVPLDWSIIYGAWCLFSGFIVGALGANWAWK